MAWSCLGLQVSNAAAGIASVTVDEQDGAQAAWLTYRARPGERNNVSVFPEWLEDGSSFSGFPLGPSAPRPTGLTVYDGALANPGPGCQRAPDAREVRCEIPAGALVGGARVYLGDRGDRAEPRWPGTEVFAGPGDDYIEGEGLFRGGPGNDEISGKGLVHGGPGNDDIVGGGQLFGGDGRDSITGGSGRDQITPGGGKDFVEADEGNDTIRARDGRPDYIDCDRGRDAVAADAIDFVDWDLAGGSARSCERIRRSSPARAIPDEVYAYEGDSLVQVQVFCPYDGPRRCIGWFEFRIGKWILGPDRFNMRSGFDGWEYEIGWRAIKRLDGKYGRAIVRSFDARGVLRTASIALRLYVDTPGCGDC